MVRQAENRISCIVLAAGQSRRMGSDKLQLKIGESSLLERTLQQLASISFYEKILVAKPENLLSTLATKYHFQIAPNPDFRNGLHSSIRTGIQIASGEYYLIALADQPLLQSHHYLELIHFIQQQSSNISLVRPLVQSAPGNPTIIHCSHRNEILQRADSDQGCRYLFQNHPDCFAPFHTSETAYIRDIDTVEDYEKCLT